MLHTKGWLFIGVSIHLCDIDSAWLGVHQGKGVGWKVIIDFIAFIQVWMLWLFGIKPVCAGNFRNVGW